MGDENLTVGRIEVSPTVAYFKNLIAAQDAEIDMLRRRVAAWHEAARKWQRGYRRAAQMAVDAQAMTHQGNNRMCACEEYWPGQGHHPECPTQSKSKGGPCETCAKRRDDATCGRTGKTDGVHIVTSYVPCAWLGGGCWAWEGKS